MDLAPLDTNPALAPYMAMGPSLLAAQPSAVSGALQELKDAGDWETIFRHLESSLNSMKDWRSSWLYHWNQLATFFLPRRHHWVITANRTSRGSPLNDAIIDSTGSMAIRTCSSGMWTGLTSPSRPWFKLGPGAPWVELDAAGKEWLEDVEQRIYAVLGGSNFYTTMAQAFEDVTVFGTAPVVIYEDYEDVIRCYLPCAGEYMLKVGARLSVDTLYREYVQTVLQIVEMFGVDNCPHAVVEMWQRGGGSLDTEFVVCHAIEPNFAITRRGSGAGASQVSVVPGVFTYREVYWIRGQRDRKPLSKRGFHGRPFMAARWSSVSNDCYGRSPCMDALGDNKQVQQETRRKAEYIEKGVRPPMGADPSLRNEPSSIVPGMITYFSTDNTKKGFFPLFEVDARWLPAITEDIENVNKRIEKCLFVDLFMAISKMEGVQPRNELELTKRDLERLQELGPFVQQFETEFAGPAIKRVLDILQRRKMLKPMPDSLRGVPLKIDYVSIMKLAQRSAESIAMKDVLSTMGSLSSAAKAAGVPDPLRVIDLDKSARKYADLANYPTDCIFTAEEVEQHDQIREQARQAAAAPSQAMAAVNAAKTLSETSTGGGSALSALTGGGEPGS